MSATFRVSEPRTSSERLGLVEQFADLVPTRESAAHIEGIEPTLFWPRDVKRVRRDAAMADAAPVAAA